MPYLSIVCVEPFDGGVLSFVVVPFKGYFFFLFSSIFSAYLSTLVSMLHND